MRCSFTAIQHALLLLWIATVCPCIHSNNAYPQRALLSTVVNQRLQCILKNMRASYLLSSSSSSKKYVSHVLSLNLYVRCAIICTRIVAGIAHLCVLEWRNVFVWDGMQVLLHVPWGKAEENLGFSWFTTSYELLAVLDRYPSAAVQPYRCLSRLL